MLTQNINNLKYNIPSLKEIKYYIFGRPESYIYLMIIYHVLIALATYLLNRNVPSKVFVYLDVRDIDFVQKSMVDMDNMGSFVSKITLVVILFCDFALLTILKYELPKLNLTTFKIILLEVPIFIIGYYSAPIRTMLLFFSLNTLQISVAYRWFIKKYKLFQYFFILGALILIIKLILNILGIL